MLKLSVLVFVAPLLQLAPVAGGQSVIVLPGLLTGDGSTAVLLCYPTSPGYDAYAWDLGFDPGQQTTSRTARKLAERILWVNENSGLTAQRDAAGGDWPLVKAGAVDIRLPAILKTQETATPNPILCRHRRLANGSTEAEWQMAGSPVLAKALALCRMEGGLQSSRVCEVRSYA